MPLTIALSQSNFFVGDIAGNLVRIKGLHDIAATAKADLVIFSEMATTGYPPEDLVLRKRFQSVAMQAVEELAPLTANGTAMLVGGLWCDGDALHNTAFLLDGGKVIHCQFKRHLPNYGVFDEKRVFTGGPDAQPRIMAWNRAWPAHLRGYVEAGHLSPFKGKRCANIDFH